MKIIVRVVGVESTITPRLDNIAIKYGDIVFACPELAIDLTRPATYDLPNLLFCKYKGDKAVAGYKYRKLADRVIDVTMNMRTGNLASTCSTEHIGLYVSYSQVNYSS